ncbi:MAG: AAA family ATPase [Clostridium celatum]|nr:AAA family ATPase [Clostridium celatum]
MANPNNFTKQNILDAVQYIDKNGIPDKNKSTKYELAFGSGKRYPAKYIIAVANHLANNVDISNEEFNDIEAKNILMGLDFVIETRQEKFELIITANEVTSTDERFTMDNIALGDNYKPLDTYFKKSSGEIIRRKRNKGEKKSSNQTMPRLACQIFEESLVNLSVEEKVNFPVCQYTPKSELMRGIFPSIEEFKKYRNTIEYFIYNYDDEKLLVSYCWNIFSTILFVKECLKRFGKEGDQFVLTYREKDKKEVDQLVNEKFTDKDDVIESNGYMNPYSNQLIESKNIILRGAPGTGKSYLAKEIAADIISNGYFDNYMLLSDEQKKQIEFVQFHPSYDYSDFVEGLRPKVNDDGSMGFELRDGIFKKFVARAKKNFYDSQKSEEVIEKEASVQAIMTDYFSNLELGVDELKIARGTKFYITSVDDKYINISIPENNVSNKLSLNIKELREMLESGQEFTQVKDVTQFFGKNNATQGYSYNLAIFNAIKAKKTTISKTVTKQEQLKKYIFIIDEINRGEISKIFGELFFSIDPGYRGPAGEVSTQYANLHEDPDEKLFIPDNVYIIGTMNDIDRSVDSFDFAMRRRFRFIEIKADERLEMLDALGEKKEEAIRRMTALNSEISKVEDLNENYHIGAAYFLKLKTLSFDQLWTDYLQPLLQDYVRGMYDEESIMKKFAKAYENVLPRVGDGNDGIQD